ncbi:hypothetical protein [Micromonospora sp. NPDC051006]|uniref:hypothetical protein n=1 Tax=Micromonospora sp. NPDC051006 TaxID=3364283 RepID=UPI0037A0F2AC
MIAPIAIGVLLWLCLVLVVLLIGRDRAANKAEARLHRIADDLAEQLATEQVKARHLQERNAELRDELNEQTGEPSMTEAVYADLAELPITYPGDAR